MAEQIKQVFNDQGASERVIFVFTTDKAGLNHCASEDENLLESSCSFLGQVVQHILHTVALPNLPMFYSIPLFC